MTSPQTWYLNMKQLILICLILCGCAAASEQEITDREYRQAVDRVNWKTCEAVYKAHGKPTFHKGHTHQRIKALDSNHYVRQDLMSNNCRALLKSGGLWNEY